MRHRRLTYLFITWTIAFLGFFVTFSSVNLKHASYHVNPVSEKVVVVYEDIGDLESQLWTRSRHFLSGWNYLFGNDLDNVDQGALSRYSWRVANAFYELTKAIIPSETSVAVADTETVLRPTNPPVPEISEDEELEDEEAQEILPEAEISFPQEEPEESAPTPRSSPPPPARLAQATPPTPPSPPVVPPTPVAELVTEVVEETEETEEEVVEAETPAEEVEEIEAPVVRESISVAYGTPQSANNSGGGGSGSSEEEVEEEVALEIVVTTPTSTPFTTTTENFVIQGTTSETVSYITINSATSSDFVIDPDFLTWQIPVELDMSTNTLIFVAYSDTKTSTAVTIEIVREAEPADPPMISVTSPSSTSVTTSLATTTISGVFNTSTDSITVNGVATSSLTMNTSSLTWSMLAYLNENSTNTFSFVGFDTASTSSSSEETIEIVQVTEIEVVLDTPDVLDLSTSTVNYVAFSSATVSGSNSETVTVVTVFNNTNGTSVTSTQLTTTTWEANVNLEEGENDLVVSGFDDVGNSSPTSSIGLTSDTVAPVISASTFGVSISSSTATTTIPASDATSAVADYEAQLIFAALSDTPTDDCPTNTDIILTSTSSLLQDHSAYTTQLTNTDPACNWFSATSSTNELSFEFSTDFQTYSVTMRVRATDSVGNTSDWDYSEALSFSNITAYSSGDAIISELAWAGTVSAADDEWIELLVMKAGGVNFEGWKLAWGNYDAVGGTYQYEVNLPTTTLQRGQTMLLERDEDFSVNNITADMIYSGPLDNWGGHMYLFDGLGNVIEDLDSSGSWFAGTTWKRETMTRIDFYGDASTATSWCSFWSCPIEATEFGAPEQNGFDVGGVLIRGTPKWPFVE